MLNELILNEREVGEIPPPLIAGGRLHCTNNNLCLISLYSKAGVGKVSWGEKGVWNEHLKRTRHWNLLSYTLEQAC